VEGCFERFFYLLGLLFCNIVILQKKKLRGTFPSFLSTLRICNHSNVYWKVVKTTAKRACVHVVVKCEVLKVSINV
jgi:hypothetical protein